MHANKHSIYLYNCFLCKIFLLLQRYGEEKKKPPTEEEMLKILAGADKKDWGGGSVPSMASATSEAFSRSSRR